MEIKRKWTLFLLLNLLLWSAVPLLRLSLPMDTQEAIVWGKYSLLGTTKHPPFSGIIAYYFYLLSGKADGSMYLLSQIFVALGLVYVYKLASLFVDKNKAVLASMLQLGVIYYNFSSVEYNVNVISLSLWPMSAYYFWQAYQQNKLKDWVLFGLLCGINLLNKYTGVLLPAAMGVFLLSSKKSRKQLLNYKAYLAVVCAVLLFVPHIWWLAEHNFETLDYFLMRNTNKVMSSEWRHLWYPLKFAGSQMLFVLAAVLSYAVFYKISEKEERPSLKDEKSRFLLICGFMPMLVFMTISLIAGTPLKSMWGFPCQFLVGLMLVYFWPAKINEAKAGRYSLIMAGWSLLFAFAYGAQCLLTTSERFRSDCPTMVKMLEQKWTERTGGQKLEYIGSDVWFANMFTLYADHDVKPMIWLNPNNNPWFDAADFEEKGAFVVAANYNEYMKYKDKFGDKLTFPQNIKVAYSNFFGKVKVRDIFYGFYNVKEAKNAE